jgi:hypothetical protein
MEWWNTGSNKYKTPSQHLFETLGLPITAPATGEYPCGKGRVYVIAEEPKEFVLKPNGDAVFFATIKQAVENSGKRLETKNHLYLERGAYVIAAVMDESVSSTPLALNGIYIDLF